jgi:hypothetical protein
MRTPSSLAIKKQLPFIVITLVTGIIISLASTAYFANKIVSQLKEVAFDEPIKRDQQLKSISNSLHYLNLSVSNPFFALTTLIATTPQTFLPTARALNSADKFVAATSDFLHTQKDSEIDISNAATFLSVTLPQINNTLLAISDLHIGGLLSPLDKKLKAVREQAVEMRNTTTTIAPVLQIFPGISGQSSPRNYLIAFQNSAEARGTGGLIGAYAVLNIDKGTPKFSAFGSNAGLSHLDDIPIQMPDEFVRLYNDDPGMWLNSNMSPHFPYGAQIWLALWKNQFKQDLDGVITVDPAALSYLLKATGPIEVEGQVITAENVVQVTLSDVYKKYETDNNLRKAFLIKIIKAVSAKIEAKEFSSVDLLKQMVHPINQHRILFYSTKKSEQEILETSDIAGAIATKLDNQYRLVIQNTAGNKMDYYLKRDLKIETLKCGKSPETKVTFTLTNTASKTAKLPAYVAGRLDLNKPQGVANSHGTRAVILPPTDAYIISAVEKATKESFGFLAQERGRRGVGVQVDLAAGESEQFTLVFGGGKGPLTTYVQPLVIDQKTTIIDRCSR